MQGRKGKRTVGPQICLICSMGTVLEAKSLLPEAKSIDFRMKIRVCRAGIQESCLGVEAVTRTAMFIVPALCDRHSSVFPLCSHTLNPQNRPCSGCHYHLLRRVDQRPLVLGYGSPGLEKSTLGGVASCQGHTACLGPKSSCSAEEHLG